MDRRHFLRQGFQFSALALFPSFSQGRLAPNDYKNLNVEILKHQGVAWSLSRKGRVVAGSNLDVKGQSLSITKVICTLLVSKALSEKWLQLHEPVSVSFPSWKSDSAKRSITIQHLLQQTSGLESGAKQLYTYRPKDKTHAAEHLEIINEPGSVFRYGPASWELLAGILDRKLRAKGTNLNNWLHQELLHPLSITPPTQWRRDGLGLPYLSTGAALTQNEMQNLGRCVMKLLQGSNSNGFKSAHFVACTNPSAVNPMFGGGLWRGAPSGTHPTDVENALQSDVTYNWPSGTISPYAPSSLIAMIGSNGKRIYLWPQNQLILTRTGYGKTWSDVDFLKQRQIQSSLYQM